MQVAGQLLARPIERSITRIMLSSLLIESPQRALRTTHDGHCRIMGYLP
jgi:hypothetical protein